MTFLDLLRLFLVLEFLKTVGWRPFRIIFLSFFDNFGKVESPNFQLFSKKSTSYGLSG